MLSTVFIITLKFGLSGVSDICSFIYRLDIYVFTELPIILAQPVVIICESIGQ